MKDKASRASRSTDRAVGQISVRTARPADIPRMVELLGELFALESDFTPNRTNQADGLISLLADPTGRAAVFVADHGGTIVGMASVQTLISTAEGGRAGLVEDVVVSRACRGQGIGTALLKEIAAWGRRRGLRRFQLLADRENGAALDFYARNGWSRTKLICLRQMP